MRMRGKSVSSVETNKKIRLSQGKWDFTFIHNGCGLQPGCLSAEAWPIFPPARISRHSILNQNSFHFISFRFIPLMREGKRNLTRNYVLGKIKGKYSTLFVLSIYQYKYDEFLCVVRCFLCLRLNSVVLKAYNPPTPSNTHPPSASHSIFRNYIFLFLLSLH